MRIRAITIGQNIPFLEKNEVLDEYMDKKLENFRVFNEDMIDEFKKINLIVDSKRLCTQPLFSYEDHLIFEKNLDATLIKINDQLNLIQKLLKKHEFDYFSSCAMLAEDLPDFGIFERLLLKQVPTYLKNYENFFISLPAATSKKGINFSALKSGARIIKDLSKPDPLNNLKFCVSANVKPNTPFFPAAYHYSDKPLFSIALEMADEIARIFRKSSTLYESKDLLKKKNLEIYNVLVSICEKLSKKHDIGFYGIDFSPAPFPKLTRSIGYALEKLNFEYFGSHGMLAAIALIHACIPLDKEKVIGFSGFMQPVLEDYVIAKSLSENKFNLDTLLLYSTMCGTGLDCVPLPGDITEKELFYILLDVCTLSVILNKPLTARLMPIPGKKEGDDVDFEFEYFTPSKVISTKRLSHEIKDDLFSRKEKFFNFF